MNAPYHHPSHPILYIPIPVVKTSQFFSPHVSLNHRLASADQAPSPSPPPPQISWSQVSLLSILFCVEYHYNFIENSFR